MWITLDQIECLDAVEREGSLTMAAEKLHKAKSAVHYSLRKLEEQVGFALLETGTYRGVLTERGRQFLFKSRPLLEQAKALKEEVHQIATGIEARVSLSATAVFDMKKINRVIKKIQGKFPNTEIVFHREILSGEKFLRRGIVDMSIFESSRPNDEFEVKKIDGVKLFLVIAKGHEFLRLPKGERGMEDLFRFPQVVQRSTIPDEDVHGVYQLSRRWTVSDLAAKRQIILDGLGWGRLPEHEICEDLRRGKLVVLDELESATEIPICIGRPKGRELGVVSQAIWEMFGEDAK